jgi:hypothetical protein
MQVSGLRWEQVGAVRSGLAQLAAAVCSPVALHAFGRQPYGRAATAAAGVPLEEGSGMSSLGSSR